MSPPPYDATAPPAYVFYEAGHSQAPAVPTSPPKNYPNPTYQVDPTDNTCATMDNTINESKNVPQ